MKHLVKTIAVSVTLITTLYTTVKLVEMLSKVFNNTVALVANNSCHSISLN